MIFGKFIHSLDVKNRLVIPSKIRNDLFGKLFILRGFDGPIALYNESSFKNYLDELQKLSFFQKDARSLLRIAMSSVTEVELDNKFRIVLPQDILNEYGIKSEVCIIGVGDHIEIWSLDKWSEYESKGKENFEEYAEGVLKL